MELSTNKHFSYQFFTVSHRFTLRSDLRLQVMRLHLNIKTAPYSFISSLNIIYNNNMSHHTSPVGQVLPFAFNSLNSLNSTLEIVSHTFTLQKSCLTTSHKPYAIYHNAGVLQDSDQKNAKAFKDGEGISMVSSKETNPTPSNHQTADTIQVVSICVERSMGCNPSASSLRCTFKNAFHHNKKKGGFVWKSIRWVTAL